MPSLPFFWYKRIASARREVKSKRQKCSKRPQTDIRGQFQLCCRTGPLPGVLHKAFALFFHVRELNAGFFRIFLPQMGEEVLQRSAFCFRQNRRQTRRAQAVPLSKIEVCFVFLQLLVNFIQRQRPVLNFPPYLLQKPQQLLQGTNPCKCCLLPRYTSPHPAQHQKQCPQQTHSHVNAITSAICPGA